MLAPAITGIPELVIAGKTGFLYKAGSMDDFVARLLLDSLADAGAETICLPAAAGNWTRYGMRPECKFARTSIAGDVCNHLVIYSSGASARKQKAFLMKILYCNKYNYPFSGTEVYLFELMELMREQGHQVALFSMADPRGEPTPYDRYLVPKH